MILYQFVFAFPLFQFHKNEHLLLRLHFYLLHCSFVILIMVYLLYSSLSYFDSFSLNPIWPIQGYNRLRPLVTDVIKRIEGYIVNYQFEMSFLTCPACHFSLVYYQNCFLLALAALICDCTLIAQEDSALLALIHISVSIHLIAQCYFNGCY